MVGVIVVLACALLSLPAGESGRWQYVSDFVRAGQETIAPRDSFSWIDQQLGSWPFFADLEANTSYFLNDAYNTVSLALIGSSRTDDGRAPAHLGQYWAFRPCEAELEAAMINVAVAYGATGRIFDSERSPKSSHFVRVTATAYSKNPAIEIPLPNLKFSAFRNIDHEEAGAWRIPTDRIDRWARFSTSELSDALDRRARQFTIRLDCNVYCGTTGVVNPLRLASTHLAVDDFFVWASH